MTAPPMNAVAMPPRLRPAETASAENGPGGHCSPGPGLHTDHRTRRAQKARRTTSGRWTGRPATTRGTRALDETRGATVHAANAATRRPQRHARRSPFPWLAVLHRVERRPTQTQPPQPPQPVARMHRDAPSPPRSIAAGGGCVSQLTARRRMNDRRGATRCNAAGCG